MPKCPKCGTEGESYGEDADGSPIYYCKKCNRAWTGRSIKSVASKAVKSAKESGVHGSDVVTLVILFIGIVVTFFGFSQTKALITYVLSIVYPDFPMPFLDMALIAASMLVLLALVGVARSGTTPALIMLTMMTLYLVFFPAVSSFVQSELVTKYLNAIGCTIQYRDNPQALSMCQQTASGGPVATKTGGKVVLKASFDQYAGSTIYGNETNLNYDAFLLSVVIENPSGTETIKYFSVSDGSEGESYMIRSGNVKSSDRIKLAYLQLLGGECGNSCSIAPMEKKTLSFKAVPINYCGDFTDSRACESDADKGCVWDVAGKCMQTDKLTTRLDANVAFSYDYEVQGSFDFVLANSNAAASTALSTRKAPTSSAGPVDVIVYFAPTYYVTAAGPESEMRLTVTLNNLNAGKTADIKTVHIARMNDGALERSGTTCSTPWGTSDFIKDQTEGTVDKILVIGKAHLSKSQRYVCTYSITAPSDWGTQDVSKTVPFIVDIRYTYNDYISLSESGRPITVERY